MIAAIIVIGTILFAGIYVLAYCLRPELRRQIERPKYVFQDQLQQYNETSDDQALDRTGGPMRLDDELDS